LNTGYLEEFDNRKIEITPEHVMASGALPPSFPAIKIGPNYYWDAGISSNTPLMTLLGEDSSDRMLCFMVDLFSNHEEQPSSMMEVMKRKKDLEFASRYHRMLRYFCRFHELHSALAALCRKDPKLRDDPALKNVDYKEPCTISLVRFHYKDKPYELWSKDFDFSIQSIQERREAGYRDVEVAMEDAKWFRALDQEQLGGVVLHEYPKNI
jgi:NTE family protein